MSKLLSLDLSTTATGYALFQVGTGKLLEHGVVKPESKGLSALVYPTQQVRKLQNLSAKIKDLIDQVEDLKYIVIEEINHGKNRLGQKVLDGFHFMLLDRIQDRLPIVAFMDSDGATGWRTKLQLKLNDGDKKANARAKALNKKIKRGEGKIPVITKKHLACYRANKEFGLNLDCEERVTDGDRADAILMGYCFLQQLHQ